MTDFTVTIRRDYAYVCAVTPRATKWIADNIKSPNDSTYYCVLAEHAEDIIRTLEGEGFEVDT